MNSAVIVLVAFTVLSLAALGAWKFYKKRKAISQLMNNIPEEITSIFNEAENLMKGGYNEDGTRTNPYQILWSIARNQARGERFVEGERGDSSNEATDVNSELSAEFGGRESIPTGTIEDSSNDSKRIRRIKRSLTRRLSRRSR